MKGRSKELMYQVLSDVELNEGIVRNGDEVKRQSSELAGASARGEEPPGGRDGSRQRHAEPAAHEEPEAPSLGPGGRRRLPVPRDSTARPQTAAGDSRLRLSPAGFSSILCRSVPWTPRWGSVR